MEFRTAGGDSRNARLTISVRVSCITKREAISCLNVIRLLLDHQAASMQWPIQGDPEGFVYLPHKKFLVVTLQGCPQDVKTQDRDETFQKTSRDRLETETRDRDVPKKRIKNAVSQFKNTNW